MAGAIHGAARRSRRTLPFRPRGVGRGAALRGGRGRGAELATTRPPPSPPRHFPPTVEFVPDSRGGARGRVGGVLARRGATRLNLGHARAAGSAAAAAAWPAVPRLQHIVLFSSPTPPYLSSSGRVGWMCADCNSSYSILFQVVVWVNVCGRGCGSLAHSGRRAAIARGWWWRGCHCPAAARRVRTLGGPYPTPPYPVWGVVVSCSVCCAERGQRWRKTVPSAASQRHQFQQRCPI